MMWRASEARRPPARRPPLPSRLIVLPLLLLSSGVALAAPPGGEDGVGGAVTPSFPSGQRTRVSVAVGTTARLECAVLSLGVCAVSWVRVRDLMILAHSGAVFASDSRLDVAVDSSPDGVTRQELTISNARSTDSGRYECQLNTNPKMSLFFDLNVYEKKQVLVSTRIGGPAARRVRLGDKFSLECEARDERDDSSIDSETDVDIRWLHEGLPLSPEAGGGVWLETQRWSNRATSKLTVGRVGASDAGRYTCTAGESSSHVFLNIRSDSRQDDGEKSEAMQSDQEESAVPDHVGLGPRSDLVLTLLTVMLATARAA